MNTKINKTTKFLIPLVILNNNNKEFPISKLQELGLVNAYIDDHGLSNEDYDWYNKDDKYLYLLFKTETTDKFLNLETLLKKFKNWIDYYDVENDNYTMHVFKISDIFISDYYKFIHGKYSQFSQKLKNLYLNPLIIGIVNKYENTRQQMSIIYNCEIPKTQEFMSIPDMEDEIYRYNSSK